MFSSMVPQRFIQLIFYNVKECINIGSGNIYHFKNKQIIIQSNKFFVCLSDKIWLTTEPIEFLILGKFHQGPMMVFAILLINLNFKIDSELSHLSLS